MYYRVKLNYTNDKRAEPNLRGHPVRGAFA